MLVKVLLPWASASHAPSPPRHTLRSPGPTPPLNFSQQLPAFLPTAPTGFRVGSVGAVPPGAKLFSGYHIVLQASLNLREPQVRERVAEACCWWE